MTSAIHYDSIIIGAGQAGGPLSSALAQAGRKTALIEREHVGGTCINEGCTPTKTMVASARVAYLTRRAADYGVHTGDITIDMLKVRDRKRAIVESFRGGSERRIKATEGLELIEGEASSAVQTRWTWFSIPAENIHLPPIRSSSIPAPDLRSHRLRDWIRFEHFNSTSIMELDAVPEHLIVLGGGYIGLEFGQMFRRFGSRVTIVQRGAKLLAREDDDIADAVAEILREDGMEHATEHDRVAGRTVTSGKRRVDGQNADGEARNSRFASVGRNGRTPNTDRLNLDAAGVTLDKHGFITVMNAADQRRSNLRPRRHQGRPGLYPYLLR